MKSRIFKVRLFTLKNDHKKNRYKVYFCAFFVISCLCQEIRGVAFPDETGSTWRSAFER